MPVNPTWAKDKLEDLGDQVDIGMFTYGTPDVIGRGQITIGKFCLIGPNVELCPLGDHRWEWASPYPFSQIELFKWVGTARPQSPHRSEISSIYIGNEVWLGYKSTILHGAEIGDGAVVGARAVVAGKVEPYSIVVGNPAKEIHKRFDDATIEAMMRIRWWDWPVEVIMANLDLLTQPPDIEKLEAVWQSVRG